VAEARLAKQGGLPQKESWGGQKKKKDQTQKRHNKHPKKQKLQTVPSKVLGASTITI